MFGGLEAPYQNFDKSYFVVQPVPYDLSSTWGKGADLGPEAILEASANMELYDIETDSEVYRHGIFTAEPLIIDSSPDILCEEVHAQTTRFLNQGKFVVTLGGEHSVSIGAIKAHCEKHSEVSILQIDAHADMRESYKGSPFNHACVMARVKEWGDPVMVGIRSMDVSERDNVKQATVFFAHQIRQNPEWQQDVVSSLKKNVYLTIDLDGFDPSIMSATGTPEPGGLYWDETLKLFEMVAKHHSIIGFDVVELCPNQLSQASNFMAARLVYKLMTLIKYYEKR